LAAQLVNYIRRGYGRYEGIDYRKRMQTSMSKGPQTRFTGSP
jgi:hypothetical protein